MAFTYGFYNSLNGDRKYNAFQMTQMFDGIILDGVFEAIGQHFAVTPAGGMTVNVGTGRAWFNHTWNDNDSILPITLPLSDLNRSRYDAVVLEVGDPNADRTNSIKIVSGAAAVYPAKPLLNRGATNNDTHDPNSNTLPPYQHALAYILVKPGVEEITAADIEIVVGKNETPFVTGPLETHSIEELFNQWDAQFNDWFNNLKAQLTDNVVTNLQNQIDNLNKKIDDNWNKTLSSSTKGVLGLPQSATPDDAFLKLAVGAGNYGYRVKVIFPNGAPAAGATLSGINPLPGKNLVTDSNGIAIGVSPNSSVTITATIIYADVKTTSITASSRGIITDVTFTLVYSNGEPVDIPSSNTYMHSPYVTSMDFCGFGAGGGGGGNSINRRSSDHTYYTGGGGGGGGYANSAFGVAPHSSLHFTVHVGAGGAGGSGPTQNVVTNGTNGGNGGATTVVLGGVTKLIAYGGYGGTSSVNNPAGGAGNGAGGAGSSDDRELGGLPGSNGSGSVFNVSGWMTAGGGGGGGDGGQGGTIPWEPSPGGSANGGAAGSPGGISGGGGGGNGSGWHNGGNGGQGYAWVIFHH